MSKTGKIQIYFKNGYFWSGLNKMAAMAMSKNARPPVDTSKFL